MSDNTMNQEKIAVIVPAAGVGSRMQASLPKQYLTIHGITILEHTIACLLQHPRVDKIVIAIGKDDPYYTKLSMANDARVIRVAGGSERADSVLSGLNYLDVHLSEYQWVMVHDAARPCLTIEDIDKLISSCLVHDVGGILASPVRDTMKRGNGEHQIGETVERADLWHALTPQMFRRAALKQALSSALEQGVTITDEASAMEWAGLSPLLVSGRADNIKVTQPEDLALAEFYLQKSFNKE
ncbi:2-C-methyl-D-erythritol 4-phosphate cytidylyltransferase [Vibrio tapetis subsp. quintayensis]|nr:2-C-methyl-D-erythritol 4-phosphate cytidylyltransferase [Vibrio tapetis]MDN3681677.1 2-C-methyl-D-erythritol 4-phosphate cytidylyltransferase [Vibrio tapetis subsp. quintayensis]